MAEKSIVGDLINFRGLVYSPVNEQGVVLLFGKVAGDLNMYVEEIKTGFPDCIARRFVGRGWERVPIEFEYLSSNFLLHGHDAQQADMVVCWEHDWQDCPVEVIALKDIIPTLPNEPVSRPDSVPPGETRYDMDYHYRRLGMTKQAIALWDKFDNFALATDSTIWRKITKGSVSYYSPERVFCYVSFRKSGLRLDFFTGGQSIDGVKPLTRSPKWGNVAIKQEDNLDPIFRAYDTSLQLIRGAVAGNELTGWYSQIPEEVEES